LKDQAKKIEPAPHRIIRKFTAEERARWERAVAEENTDANRLAAGKMAHGIREGRAELRRAFATLRAERERQGLSLAQMEARTGIAESTLRALEDAEEANPTFGELCGLAEALGRKLEINFHAPPISQVPAE
jgi:ribosome-binding protein aMBF1 (putative translation factor)